MSSAPSFPQPLTTLPTHACAGSNIRGFCICFLDGKRNCKTFRLLASPATQHCCHALLARLRRPISSPCARAEFGERWGLGGGRGEGGGVMGAGGGDGVAGGWWW